MMKWGAADVIRYHIVGVYQDASIVSGDGAAIADVTDRVVFDFTWKLSEMKLVGKPTFHNFKTTVAKPRDRDGKCMPPVLKGDYEHYDVLGIKDGLSGMLEIQVQTIYPVVDIPQMCTGKPKAVPQRTMFGQSNSWWSRRWPSACPCRIPTTCAFRQTRNP